MDEHKILERMLDEHADKFRQFSRNGRWGTCGSCPFDHRTKTAYPEFCKETNRYDHNLDADQLVSLWNRTSVIFHEIKEN